MKRAWIIQTVKPHLHRALRDINKYGVPKGRESTIYSFLHGGRLYPPKYLVASAFNLATGRELSPDDHHGGEQDSNRVLKDLIAAGAIRGEIVRQPSNRPHVLRPASAAEERQARKRIEKEISRRQGGGKFRQKVLEAYAHRCAITGCDADAALEAAHIRTYTGLDDNDVRNGILLRADIHTLFDLGLIGVRTSTRTVLIKNILKGTCYESLGGRPVRLPANAALWNAALDYHCRNTFGARSLRQSE